MHNCLEILHVYQRSNPYVCMTVYHLAHLHYYVLIIAYCGFTKYSVDLQISYKGLFIKPRLLDKMRELAGRLKPAIFT